MIAKEVSGYAKKSRLLQSSSALRVAVPGHFDGLRSTVEGCYEQFNLAAIADQPQTRTRRTRQP